MKLRNKKTGKIKEFDSVRVLKNSDCTLAQFTYDNLAELNDEWMDYTPRKPLIKDERIRKAVIAWAEANNAKEVFICAMFGGWGVRYDLGDEDNYSSIDILFKGGAPLQAGERYTISELCGEEEE